MHAIYPLISGIQGAASGTARIYARGTTTRANYWLDFEGTQQVLNTADIPLDSNGGVEVYVNQLVDVTVFSVDGDEIRSFVAGSNATNVELRSQSFTGTDYITGAQAAGNPTTVQAALDRAFTSFGALDWKVLIGATPTLLSTALAGVTGVVFNVKSPTYGALGNGTSDDSSAIQAAITAAAVAGGTVVFPPGTYRIVSALNLSTNVNLVGSGSWTSILKLDHATNSALQWGTATENQKSIISGLGFIMGQAGSGVFVDPESGAATNNVAFCIDHCRLDGRAYPSTSRLVGGQTTGRTGVTVEVYRSLLLVNGTGDGFAAGSGQVRLIANRFVVPAGAYNNTLAQILSPDGLVAAFNQFDASAATSGTFDYLFNTESAETGILNAIVGNAFLAPTGGTGTVHNGNAQEWGNTAGIGVLFTSTITSTTSYSSASALGRERTYRRVAQTTATYTIPSDAGTIVMTNTYAGDLTLTTPAFAPGRRFRLYFHNNDGSARGCTFALGSGATYLTPNASVTMNANTYTQVDFEFIYLNATPCLRYVVTDANRAEPP